MADFDSNAIKRKMEQRHPLSQIQDFGVLKNNMKPEATKTSPNGRENEEPAPKRLKPRDSIIKEFDPLFRDSPLRSLNSNRVAKNKDLEFLVEATSENNLNDTFVFDQCEDHTSEIKSYDDTEASFKAFLASLNSGEDNIDVVGEEKKTVEDIQKTEVNVGDSKENVECIIISSSSEKSCVEIESEDAEREDIIEIQDDDEDLENHIKITDSSGSLVEEAVKAEIINIIDTAIKRGLKEGVINKKLEKSEAKDSNAEKSSVDEESSTEKNNVDKDYSTEENSGDKDSSTEENNADKDSSTEKNSADKDSSTAENSVDKDYVTDENSVDKDSLTEENSVDKDSVTEGNSRDKDSNTEENSADKDSNTEKNSAGKDSNTEENSADKGSSTEENSADKGSGTEKNSVDKDSGTEENSRDKDSITEEKSADKDCSTEENSADKDSSTEENSADKDSSTEENSVDKASVTEENSVDKNSVTKENSVDKDFITDENSVDKDCVTEESSVDKDSITADTTSNNSSTSDDKTIEDQSLNLSTEKMAEISKKIEQEQDIADLKLQLNAAQQARASLELQVRQKEEIIIKAQAEALKKEQNYLQEIKSLKDKIEEFEKSSGKDMEETIKNLKAKEAKLISELNFKNNDEMNFKKVMEEYEKSFNSHLSELKKLKGEHEVAKQHLAAVEAAFSDVHQKYERAKTIINGFKTNEDTLKQQQVTLEEIIRKSDEKYESLKAHAKAQIENANKEIMLAREKYEAEIHKLTTIIKRLEIKNSSLVVALDQKVKECSALAALCDEVTGQV